MAIQFTRNGRKAMLWAQVEAMRRGDSYVESEHLLLGLLHGEDTGALRLIDRMGMDAAAVRDAAQANLSPESAGPRVETSQLSPTAKKVVAQARRETEDTNEDYVGTAHLLMAILRGGEAGIDTSHGAYTSLSRMGMTYDRASAVLKNGSTHGPDGLNLADIDIVSVVEVPKPRGGDARPGFLKGRDFLSVDDLSASEIWSLFELTREIKAGKVYDTGLRKTLALLFEKPSLRTRTTFGVAMTRLGGQHIYLGRDEVGLGTRESVPDVAKGLSRWVDAIAARTFSDQTVQELAEFASVPVINALSDAEHPCQALADFYTILEYRSNTAGMKFVFVGDGNNVAISLMLLAPRLGTHFTLVCPPGYEPPTAIIERTRAAAAAHGTRFEISHDPIEASDDADILYTDVWTSMGQEEESTKRVQDFAGFQVNADLIREAKDDVLILHCLPAHRGEEISAEAIDGPHSAVFDQAENRLHVQQALLAAIL